LLDRSFNTVFGLRSAFHPFLPLPVVAAFDPLRKFNINHEQLAFVFFIVWLRLATWDY
jgi:hypothetical protein